MKRINLFLLGLVLIFTDQAVKWWMIKYHPSLVLINRGIIFGFIENQFISFSFLVLGILALIWIARNKEKGKWPAIALVFIAAGAFSNIIDRIFQGGVVDYFAIRGLNTFNLADIYIIGGVILYTCLVFQHSYK